MNGFDNFDRNFNRMQTFVKTFIAIVFVLVVLGFIAYGLVIIYTATHPQQVGEFGGKIIKGILQGVTNQ